MKIPEHLLLAAAVISLAIMSLKQDSARNSASSTESPCINSICPLSFLTPALLAAAPVEIVPPELRGAVQPPVAVAPSGRIHVVIGKDNTIYHTTSEPGWRENHPVRPRALSRLKLNAEN